jgi:putative transposase
MSKGASVVEVCKKIGVTDVTFYRWRKLYGGMQIPEAKRMKEMEKENARLRKLVADLSIDNQILKEVAKGNF